MVNLTDLLQKNAVVIAGVVLVVLFSVWFVSSFGVPLLGNSPDTFEPQSVTSIDENADTVAVQLSDPTKADRTSVVAGGEEYQWNDNNTVRIDKDELNGVVTVESYSGGNLYQSHDYTVGEIGLNIVSDSDEFLSGQSYTFEIIVSGSSGEPTNPEWVVANEELEADSTSIVESFDEPGNYNISVTANVEGRQIETSREINVTSPEDVNFDIIVRSANATEFEGITQNNGSVNATEFDEIRAKTNLTSNQTIEEVTWDWGADNRNETLPINETSLNWYTEPGNYTVTATGRTTGLGREVTATETINIKEKPAEQITYEIAVQVFSEERGKALREANVSLGELVSKETGQDGTVEFEVVPGQYDITSQKPRFEREELSVNVNDNVLLEVIMSEIPTEEESNNTENETEVVEEGVDAFDVNRNISASENLTQEQIDASAPDGLERLLNETPGNGTRNNPHLIRNVEELQAISSAPSQRFRLANDIDASNTRGWNPVGAVSDEQVGSASQTEYEVQYDSILAGSVNLTVTGETVPQQEYQALPNGSIFLNQSVNSIVDNATEDSTVTASYTTDNVYRGFNPISSEGQTSLELDGRGNTISGLYIDRDEDNVGMISGLDSGIIENVNFEEATVRGQDKTGILASSAKSSRIENVLVAGVTNGGDEVGGLVGRAQGTEISGIDSIGTVRGNNGVGMVVGSASASGSDVTTLKRVSSKAPSNTGVEGNASVGGIVGQALGAEINNSFSASNVVGEEDVGGIAGTSRSGTTIKKGYSASFIESDSSNAGAIVGQSGGAAISDFYWDTETADVGNAVGDGSGSASISGLTTVEMQGENPTSTMSALDFDGIWQTTDKYPVVSSQSGLLSVTVSVVDASTDEEINQNSEVTLGGETIRDENITFEDIARGEYTIRADSDSYIAAEKTEFISESRTIRFALEPAEQYDVTLSAVGVDDNIIPDAAIALDGEQKIQGSGPVEFTDVDEGTYNPEFEKGTHVNRDIELELSGDEGEGGSVSRSIVLRETRNIEITLKDSETSNNVETKANYTVSGPTSNEDITNVTENPYEISNVPEITSGESYSISIDASGYNATTLDLQPDEVTNSTTETVQLGRSNINNVLRLRPEDADSGNLATPVSMEVTQLGTGEIIQKSTEVGDTEAVAFILKNTTRSGVGDVTVDITSDTYEDKTVTGISLDDNKQRTISLRNKEDRTFTVLRDSDGSTIENARVEIKSANPSDIPYDNTSRTNPEGTVPFSKVINGDYDITINAKGYEKKSRTVTLGTGDNPTFRLNEEPVAVIELSTEIEDGKEKYRLESVGQAPPQINKQDDVTSASIGDTNPTIKIKSGVRYRFEGSGISASDVNVVNSDGDNIVSQNPSTSIIDQSGNLDVGYISEGTSFEFTARTVFSDVSGYRDANFQSGGLDAGMSFVPKPPS